MPNNKKIVTVTDGTSDGDMQAIEVKVDRLLEVKSTGPPPVAIRKPNLDQYRSQANVKFRTPESKSSSLTSDVPKNGEDGETDAAVTSITREEADKALADLDASVTDPDVKKTTPIAKVKRFFAAWWRNKRARWGTIAGLVVLLLVLAILPPSRSFALNLAGVRATASLTVLDATTQLPLKNANVSLGNVLAQSDAKGHVTLKAVKLGSQPLTVHKIAFATIKKSVSTGLGSNDLGMIALKAVGAQYHFKVTDYISGKPVTIAQAASGQATAVADKKGEIVLTVTDTSADSLSVSITASGYRTATAKVTVGSTQTTPVALVTSSQNVYISRQTGKYDVYKSDLDGTNKKLLLAATGNENSTNTLVPNADGQVAALINNRDTTKDSSGYVLQTLTLINVDTGASTVVDHSERIQPVGWIGDRLVYVAIKAGASAANPSRYLLMSYDYKTNQRLQLDHANAFNDVVSANGSIYYATSNGYNGGVSQFLQIDTDNSNKQVLLVSEVWNVFRQDFSNFRLATGDTAYTYKLGDSKPVSTTASYNGQNRLYIDSPDGKHSLYVDDRDGKGTLISYDTTTKKETELAQAAGLNYPVRWLGNDTIIYRLSTAKETADYAVSATGGATKKITDVTNTPGISLWYFY